MGKMILSGSRAIKYYFPDFPRECKDWDFIVDVPFSKSNIKGVEYKCIPPLLNRSPKINPNVLTPNEIFTLKCSHMFWDKNWEKHHQDLIFLRDKYCVIIPDLFYKLVSYWESIFGPRLHSDLTLSKEEFFDNKLSEKYDHDELHKQLVYPNNPAYLSVLKDGSDVEPDESKFKALEIEGKIDLVNEEVMVMAYERRKTQDPTTAYKWMLKKFIMNHAPLWESLFILNNIEIFQEEPFDYVDVLDRALEKDFIRKELEFFHKMT